MTLAAVKAAVQAACLRGGCPKLAREIHVGGDGGPTTAIVRPFRALTDREAFAMCAAWLDGYSLVGIEICPGDCDDDCDRECIPDYRSEQVMSVTLPMLAKPSHRRGDHPTHVEPGPKGHVFMDDLWRKA